MDTSHCSNLHRVRMFKMVFIDSATDDQMAFFI